MVDIERMRFKKPELSLYKKGKRSPPPPAPSLTTMEQTSPKAPSSLPSSPQNHHYAKSIDNKIKSLEECEGVSLDIVNRTFPWDQCTGYSLSSNPEAAVFFIQIPDSKRDWEKYKWKVPQVLVAKNSITIAQELFGLFIAQWYHLNTPSVQLIEKFPRSDYCHPELDGDDDNKQRVGYHWKSIRDSLVSMAEQDEDFAVSQKVKKDLGQSCFYQLMEFLSKAQPLDALDDYMLEEEACEKWLFDLGRLIIVDIVLNNWDRVPVIWENNGNPGNVLMDTDHYEIYAIDQTITTILESEREEYFNRVKDFTRDHRQSEGKATESKYVQKILQFVKNPYATTGFEGMERKLGISDAKACDVIWNGIERGIHRSSKMTEKTISNIKKFVNNMKTGSSEVGDSIWEHQMNLIDEQFVYQVVQIFTE